MQAVCSDLTVRDFVARDVPAAAAIDHDTFDNPRNEKDFKRFTTNRTKTGIVAVCDRQVVGYLLIECMPDRVDVHGFAVHKSFRRRGIGKKMVGWLSDLLSQSKVYRMAQLIVHERNVGAQLFLKACRYRWVTTLPDYYGKDDGYLMEFEAQRDK